MRRGFEKTALVSCRSFAKLFSNISMFINIHNPKILQSYYDMLTLQELKKELNETKSALSKDAVNASTLASENRLFKSMLEKEQDHRKMVIVGLIRLHIL